VDCEVATKMNIKKPLEIIEQVEDSIGRWNLKFPQKKFSRFLTEEEELF
jgi:hypothetical protein